MTTPFPFVSGQVLTAAQLNDIQNLPISDKTASYTLIAGDETKRTMMNNASATTITVNNSIFTVGDVIQVANKGAGTCTITAGAGVTINTSGSLALAQYGGGYLVAISASQFVFFNLGSGANYGTATGGTSSSITVGGLNYTLLTFTSDSNLVVSKAGLFDVLLVGGGGGSGGARASILSRAGAGSGAGGLIQSTLYLAAATYAVDVGAGGAGAANDTNGNSGAGSSIGTVISVAGGGSGGTGDESKDVKATRGASNGGAAFSQSALGATIDAAAGKIGGAPDTAGGGGGGFSAVGGAASGNTGGAGGNGFDVSAFISGAAAYKATGGGGGGSSAGGAGGNRSANSNAGVTGATGNSATANSGSGGGGAQGTGGAGASGIIYVRFKV